MTLLYASSVTLSVKVTLLQSSPRLSLDGASLCWCKLGSCVCLQWKVVEVHQKLSPCFMHFKAVDSRRWWPRFWATLYSSGIIVQQIRYKFFTLTTLSQIKYTTTYNNNTL